MKIIIAPAKKMTAQDDSFLPESRPQFLPQAEKIWAYLRRQDEAGLTKIWRANPKLVKQASEYLKTDLDEGSVAALFAYQGLQYQYLAADVLETPALAYLNANLRILSALYGILRPLDRVTPYRLDFMSPLPGFEEENLYRYWGDQVYRELFAKNNVVVNLASKEYSKLVTPYLQADQRMITIDFQEQKGDKWKTFATHAKMARGRLVRFMAEEQVEEVEDLKKFGDLGYCFCPEASRDDTFVYRKG